MMKKHGRILLGVLVIALAAYSTGAAENEESTDEIRRSIEELSSRDAEVVRKATDRLRQVRSSSEITLILESLQRADETVLAKLCKILGDIGEPAVEPAFAGSLTDPAMKRSKIPWASHVLTCYLKMDALPFLLKKIRGGTAEEREVAAWAISSIVPYYVAADKEPRIVEPEAIVSALHEAASKDSRIIVKDYCTSALSTLSKLKSDTGIPALIQLLSDKAASKRACKGLARYGARASEAIPVLRRGIEQQTLPAEAFDALIAIEGKAAVRFVVKEVSRRRFDRHERATIALAFSRQPHPAAAPFMRKALWEDRLSTRERAALFFSALDPSISLKDMRKCLTVKPIGKTEQTDPCNTEVSTARNLRIIAIGYLTDHRDAASYGTILGMLTKDPSIKVRTAAAKGLGKVRCEKAVPGLKACLAEVDEGHTAIGHRDGELHAAAVEALARIGSEDAYTALYEGIGQGNASRQCSTFWRRAKDKAVFEEFLEQFERDPSNQTKAAGIIAFQLYIHREHYAIPEKDVAEARRQFLADVRDPDHFGSDADLSDGGKKEVSTKFNFYTIDFASVSFSFSSKRHRGGGRGYTMVYKKDRKAWIPVGKTNDWVE